MRTRRGMPTPKPIFKEGVSGDSGLVGEAVSEFLLMKLV
jgi:hypothetical protein